MNWDYSLSAAAAAFGHSHPNVHAVLSAIGGAYTFKVLPFIIALVIIWFKNKKDGQIAIISGIVSTFLALTISRIVQNNGPHRPRPAHIDELNFINPDILPQDWSSFPSDTAACIGALVVAIWIADRRLGAVSLVWALTILTISKFMTGAHFVTDLIAGFSLGGMSSWTCYRIMKRHKIVNDKIVHISSRYPAFFYASAFFFLFQLTTFFDDVRNTSSTFLNLYKIVKTVDG